jgi:hypothetical protein
MTEIEIKTNDYWVCYDPVAQTVICGGSLRLNGMPEYAPIVELLDTVVAVAPPLITLDLQKLQFLNSSGINVLSKFVIKVRQQSQSGLVIQGSQTIPWQGKSLKNLQRLMPTLRLELRSE